jgi:hypothetical protein
MIYHIVKRVPNAMQIYEYSFEMIDINNISIGDSRRTPNVIYFSDKKHEYSFNKSKSTLYMTFENMTLLDCFNVDILENPYEYLVDLIADNNEIEKNTVKTEVTNITNDNQEAIEELCLRLYSVRNGTKFVPQKSGLNQWNAGGRQRNANEVYIPYPVKDHRRNTGFFPPRNESFQLILPNGRKIFAKVCQDNDKAIMSNPNAELGKWLLREVFELPEHTLLTYSMLEKFGIDSVIFSKIKDKLYKIDFTEIGTYERMLNGDVEE